jgi:hypothetical protein
MAYLKFKLPEELTEILNGWTKFDGETREFAMVLPAWLDKNRSQSSEI